MSRALVIKGANFEDNRVSRVTFDNPIPCTSVAFSESSYSIFSMTDPVPLTVTTLPADTTDELTLYVADTTVAKVENGALLAVGFGTTTLTATCGDATASVTVTVERLEYTLTNVVGKRIQQASTSAWPDKQPLQMSTNDGNIAFSGNEPNDAIHNRILGTSLYSVVAIPSGTQRLEIITSISKQWSILMRYSSTENHITEQNYTMYAAWVGNENLLDVSNKGRAFCTIPNSADSFACESQEIYVSSGNAVTAVFYNTAS